VTLLKTKKKKNLSLCFASVSVHMTNKKERSSVFLNISQKKAYATQLSFTFYMYI